MYSTEPSSFSCIAELQQALSDFNFSAERFPKKYEVESMLIFPYYLISASACSTSQNRSWSMHAWIDILLALHHPRIPLLCSEPHGRLKFLHIAGVRNLMFE